MTDLPLVALDGRPLAATAFDPVDAPLASLVVLGALGVPRRYYGAFGRWMAERGVAVVTFDYRGSGESRSVPVRDDPATLLDWARLDAPAALALAATRWPGAPPWALGHSFGGQAIGLIDGAADLAGALVVAAGVGDLSLYPRAFGSALGFAFGALVPVVGATVGYVPGRLGLGEDLPIGVVREWGSWCRTRDYVRGALGRDVAQHERLALPMHFVDVADDHYVPAAAAAALRGWYERAAISHRVVTPSELGVKRLGHFGVFRRGPTERVWGELLDVVLGAPAAPPE